MTATRQIPLWDRRGRCVGYATVDSADFDRLNAYRWHRDSRGYARAAVAPGRPLFMHREVLGLRRGDGLEVDHINRDPLDNRRANLRIPTRRLQAANRGSHRGSSSRYRAVYWARDKRKWCARVRVDGRSTSLGYYDSEEAAGRAAAEWRAEHMPEITEPHPELLVETA